MNKANKESFLVKQMHKVSQIQKHNPREVCIPPQSLRTAAIHMWPAKEHLIYDGWIMRLFNPYTYRCNCVYPLRNGYINTHEKIKRCESVYRKKKYAYLFQIMPHNKRLDILLQAMAYKKVLPTRWMTMDIEKMQSGNANHPGHCMIKQSDDWPLNRKRIAGYSENEARIYGAFFKAIHLQTYPLVLEVNQTPVTCGLGVQTGKHLGIFDIRTKASFQRQGYAKILVQSILKNAYQNGAIHAQLHVDSNNHAAINLYQKLGFQPICDYWFRRA